MDPIRKKQERLQEIRDAKARWMSKLFRAATALKELDKQERRLLKRRKLDLNESKEITAKDYHQIREEFDDSDVLATL